MAELKYLLDTSTCIELLRVNEHVRLKFSFCITYHYLGESAAKELNDAMLIPITHDNP